MSLRLVDSVEYRMAGTFFEKGVPRPSVVHIEALIKVGQPLGSFSGAMLDRYGPSRINGHLTADIRQDFLEFRKTYDRKPPLGNKAATKSPVRVLVTFSDSGGWQGQWYIDSTESGRGREGFITLAIVPWSGQRVFPLHPDLTDYLAAIQRV